MILFFVLPVMSSIGTVSKSTPEKTEMSILPTSGQHDRHRKKIPKGGNSNKHPAAGIRYGILKTSLNSSRWLIAIDT